MRRFAAGRNEEVVELLEEAADLDPNHEVVYSQLGGAEARERIVAQPLLQGLDR